MFKSSETENSSSAHPEDRDGVSNPWSMDGSNPLLRLLSELNYARPVPTAADRRFSQSSHLTHSKSLFLSQEASGEGMDRLAGN
jgi:hypothetical protein